jgi:hypothetical protein
MILLHQRIATRDISNQVRIVCTANACLCPLRLLHTINASQSCGAFFTRFIRLSNRHGPVSSHTTGLDILAVDAWCTLLVDLACASTVAAIEVNVFEVESVDVPWEVTGDGLAKHSSSSTRSNVRVGSDGCDEYAGRGR